MKRQTVGGPYRSPVTSWLWLVDLPDNREALVIAGSPSVVQEMRFHFPSVTEASPTAVANLPSDRYACVVYVERSTGTFHTGVELLRHCLRVLAPEGVLAISHSNPLHYSLLGAFRTVSEGKSNLPANLSAAGFTRIDRFYLEPSHQAPLNLIPANRLAMNAHERRANTVGLRRLAVFAGLGMLLFPGVLLLGRA